MSNWFSKTRKAQQLQEFLPEYAKNDVNWTKKIYDEIHLAAHSPDYSNIVSLVQDSIDIGGCNLVNPQCSGIYWRMHIDIFHDDTAVVVKYCTHHAEEVVGWMRFHLTRVKYGF